MCQYPHQGYMNATTSRCTRHRAPQIPRNGSFTNMTECVTVQIITTNV